LTATKSSLSGDKCVLKYLSENEKQVFLDVCAYIDKYSEDRDLMHEAEKGQRPHGTNQ
jgi:hypothetical protein